MLEFMHMKCEVKMANRIEIDGRINEQGRLEVELPANLPPGRVRVILEPIDPDQAWYWSPEWQAAERESRADYEAGRYKEFSSMDDFIADLTSDDDE
jgi:hypothetical protein